MASQNDDGANEYDPGQYIPTSPVSSQDGLYRLRSSSWPPTGSWLRPSNSSQSVVDDEEIDPTKSYITKLPLELLDQIVESSDYADVPQWARCSRVFASLARKHLLKTEICFIYTGGFRHEDDTNRTRSFLLLLENHPDCVRYVQHLYLESHSRFDRLENVRRYYPLDDQEIVEAASSQWEVSPFWIFHDESLGAILSLLTNLKSLCVKIHMTKDSEKLDLRRYDEEYANAFTRIFKSKSLTSIALRGVSNIYLPHIQHANDLNEITLYDFGLIGEASSSSSVDPPASDASNGPGEFSPVKPRVMNICNIQSDSESGANNFLEILANPTSNISFSNLIVLNVGLRNFDDVMLCAAVLETCSETLEEFEMSTKYLFRSLPSRLVMLRRGLVLSLSPIKLSGLKAIKRLSVWLNFRPTDSVEEIDWFLHNLKGFPHDNVLQTIKFTIDMANHSFGPRNDLVALELYGERWQVMDDVFVGQNMRRLQRVNVVVSTPITDPDRYSLTEEVKLPRLGERGILSRTERVDFPCKNSVRRHGSFLEDL